MEFKDYYRTLEVPRDATAEQIKKAFRKFARKYHPDVSKEPNAEARMKEINEAYTVLSDPERRAAYDALGVDHPPGREFRPPPDWGAGFEFSGPGFADGDAADAERRAHVGEPGARDQLVSGGEIAKRARHERRPVRRPSERA